MPGISLTIRNLTSTPLELKLVERYALPNTSSHYGGFLRNWAGGATNGTHISSPHIAEHSQSFESQEASIAVASFQTLPTDVKFAEKSPPHEKLRLTFEVENQRYRIDVPSSKIESQTLIPLSTHAKLQFTGVFHQQQAHLTVYSSANPQSWMQMLKDATPLSACSIPGTHNSPAYYRALPTVRCQAVSPRQQLENGVRFFDIRVQIDSPTSPRLALVHAVFPVSLTGPKYLRDLLNDIFAFLDENPSETLLMSLKREGVGSFSDQDLGRILHDHYTTGKDADRWYVDPDIPTLGQVRGKIVLMRRFAIDDAMRALHDARGWATDGEYAPVLCFLFSLDCSTYTHTHTHTRITLTHTPLSFPTSRMLARQHAARPARHRLRAGLLRSPRIRQHSAETRLRRSANGARRRLRLRAAGHHHRRREPGAAAAVSPQLPKREQLLEGGVLARAGCQEV